jgi:predicted PurR-regulated permease PerM
MARERSASPLFILVAVIAVVAALYVAKQILLPISLAVLLSFLFTPLANRLESWGLPRVPAVIVVVLAAVAVIGMLGWTVTNQLQDELPSYRAKIVAKAQELKQFATRFQLTSRELVGSDRGQAKKEDRNAASHGRESNGKPVANADERERAN